MNNINFQIKIPSTSICPMVSSWGDEELANEQLSAIKQLDKVLSKIVLSHEGNDITVKIDWSNYIESAIEGYDIDKVFLSGLDESLIDKIYERIEAGTVINCAVSYLDDNSSCESVNNRRAAHYLEMVFYHIFLAMNISCPGSFSLYGAHFQVNDGDFTKFKSCPSLSNEAFKISRRDGYPQIERLCIEQTWEWLVDTVGLSFHQIAKTHIERSLYAFLHLSVSFNTTPSSLLWLSHCIEGIYKTPRQGIVEAIKKRSLLVLGEPKTNKKELRKSFDKFYGLRSSFVHGRMNVCHPSENDLLDLEYDNYQSELIDAHHFGLKIYISSLQQLIKNKATSFDFYEQVIFSSD